MEIEWNENFTKQEAFKLCKDYCLLNDLNASNSSVVTLLLPLGNFADKHEVKEYALRFFENFNAPAIISIEPVLVNNDKELKSLYKMDAKKYDLLPFYHIHALVNDEDIQKQTLKTTWQEIIGCNNKGNLFKITPAEKSIAEILNYITKFFELQRGNCGSIGLLDVYNETESIDELQQISDSILSQVNNIIKKIITILRTKLVKPFSQSTVLRVTQSMRSSRAP